MKYKSQRPTFIFRCSIKSYWLISPRYHASISKGLQNIRQNHWTMKYRSQWPIFILRSNVKSYWLISSRYHVYTSNSLQNMRQNHWTMKYRSQWPTFILRSSIKLHWLIIPRYHVYTSNSLQDIRQNHWTMKYRSQWPTFILMSSSSHTDSLFQGIMLIHQIALDIRQSHWTMKYRSQWPTFILKSSIKSYWLIIPRYHVYTWNSLQDIRQNHWTMLRPTEWVTILSAKSFARNWQQKELCRTGESNLGPPDYQSDANQLSYWARQNKSFTLSTPIRKEKIYELPSFVVSYHSVALFNESSVNAWRQKVAHCSRNFAVLLCLMNTQQPPDFITILIICQISLHTRFEI